MNILIINSKGHWKNGWAISPNKLETISKIFQKSDFNIKSVEINHVTQLEKELAQIDSDTLVWINAYWVNIGNNRLDWLNRYVEQNHLPLIGQSQKTLENLLKKDYCQSKMKAVNIPVPSYLIIKKHQINDVKNIISNSNLNFPVVIKPTNESRSSGVKIIKNITDAIHHITTLFNKFPNGHIIIEEFLPGEDITCGYLELNGEALLLPSYRIVDGMKCENENYSEEHYLLPVSAIQHNCIYDSAILEQLKKEVPSIIQLFEINSVTRVDARANKEGVLSFFDINGMPGLNFPESSLIQQCFHHFPTYDKEYIFECLINTIILDKLIQYNFNIPKTISDNNLFNLNSETIIKVKSRHQMLMTEPVY